MPKVKKYNGTKQNIAKKFLKEESKMFGFKDFEKEMKKEIKQYENEDSDFIKFQQFFNEIPVWNGGYLVAVNNQKEIYYI